MKKTSRQSELFKTAFGCLIVVLLGQCCLALPEDLKHNVDKKMVGYESNMTYWAYFSEKTFEDASKDCRVKNGKLLTIAKPTTMEKINQHLLEVHLLDDDEPLFVWMGLAWKSIGEERFGWVFDGGNPSDWEGRAKYRNWDTDPSPDQDNRHCVGLKLDKVSAEFKWDPVACDTKAPYICSEPSKVLLPSKIREDEIYKLCGQGDSLLMPIANDGQCGNNEEKINLGDAATMCSTTNQWDIHICLPTCTPEDVTNAVLVSENKAYFTGSLVTYFCPGYFTYGIKSEVITDSHTVHVPCRSQDEFRKLVAQLMCHSKDIKGVVESDRPTLHASEGGDFALKCTHDLDDLPTKSENLAYSWYHETHRLLQGGKPRKDATSFDLSKTDTLVIRHLTDEADGIYACFVKINNAVAQGNVYNVSVEHYKATEEAMKGWNSLDTKYLGMYVGEHSKTVQNFEAHLGQQATFEEAKKLCGNTSYGKLANQFNRQALSLLEGLYSPEMNPFFRMKPNTRPEYPEMLWVGLVYKKNKWQTIDGVDVPNDLPWITNRQQREDSCAAVVLRDSVVKFKEVNCNKRLAFVCSIHAKSCNPESQVTNEVVSSNYFCPLNYGNFTEVPNESCKCSADEIQAYLEDHTSCNANNKTKWDTSLCFAECSDRGYGVLLESDRVYYTGMYMTYFCGGHFEVNGNIYHQNSLSLICDPFRQEVVSITCDPNDILEENFHVDVTEVDFDKKTLVGPKPLECVFKEKDHVQIFWYKDGSRIQANTSSWTINIDSKDDLGVYMCFMYREDVLTPGNVYKITELDEAAKKKAAGVSGASKTLSRFPGAMILTTLAVSLLLW